MPTRTITNWSYQEIPCKELTALDLKTEQAEITEPTTCYRITRNDSPTEAEAVYMTESKRIGIAWGATADWADYADPEEAIGDWVNNPTRYESLN